MWRPVVETLKWPKELSWIIGSIQIARSQPTLIRKSKRNPLKRTLYLHSTNSKKLWILFKKLVWQHSSSMEACILHLQIYEEFAFTYEGFYFNKRTLFHPPGRWTQTCMNAVYLIAVKCCHHHRDRIIRMWFAHPHNASIDSSKHWLRTHMITNIFAWYYNSNTNLCAATIELW